MCKVKPLPLFGEQPPTEEAPQPRKPRGRKREGMRAEGKATQGAMNHASAGDGLPLLLVRTAEGDAVGLRRAADFVRVAPERGWLPLTIASLGTLTGAVELYLAAQASEGEAKPLLALTLPLRVGEMVEVKGKPEPIAATPLLLLARDERGWANLLKLADKGHPLDLDSLNSCGGGLAVISLGWAGVQLAGSKKEQLALNRALMVAKQACDGQLYLGVDAAEAQQATRLQKQAAELGLPLLALHQADYIDEAEASAYAALYALHDLPAPTEVRPLLTADGARTRFAALPEALEAAASLTAATSLVLPDAPLAPPSGDAEAMWARLTALPAAIGEAATVELATVEAAGLTFAYAVAAALAGFAHAQGFEVRVGAGQGGDWLALALEAGALPSGLLPVAGGVGRSLSFEYPSGREQQLLEYVAERYGGQACLLLPPPHTGLRTALREAAKASGARADDLAHLLRLAGDEGEIDIAGLSETELALLAQARRLVGRPRSDESGSRCLLLTAQSASETLPLVARPPLPTLRLSRAAASRLGAVLINLTASAALDLLDKVGASALLDTPLDDAATLALLRAGAADDIEGGGALPPIGSLGELTMALAAQLEVGDDDAATRCLAWDNYRLAYLKAHQPEQYFTVATGPLGLHPLTAHAEHWRAAVSDGRLFSSAMLPPPGSVGRALGLLHNLRRLVAADGNPLITARLHDLEGELHVFAYPPTHTTLAALGEGRLSLVYGTLLAADGKAALLVEQVSSYEGGPIGPLPSPSPSLSQRERGGNMPTERERGGSVPTDIFGAIGVELAPGPPHQQPRPSERTTTTTVNRANPNNGSNPARASGKEGARQGSRSPSATQPPPTVRVRRLHLRLPVSDDADADTDRLHQIADIAKRNPGPDLLLLFIRSGNYEVRIEPHGFNVDADSFKREVSAALGHNPIFDEDQIEVAQLRHEARGMRHE